MCSSDLNRICYQYSRRKDGRRIALARRAGDSGDGGDSDIGIPPRMSRHRHPDILLSEAARRRIAGRQPCFKGVQRERLAHDFAGQSVVCYTL